jgi:hypothetical protein
MPTYKTDGIDPKLVAQLIASAIAWAVARFAGIDLPPEAEVAIAAVVGVIVGYLAPAPRTKPKTNGAAVVEPGGGAGV